MKRIRPNEAESEKRKTLGHGRRGDTTFRRFTVVFQSRDLQLVRGRLPHRVQPRVCVTRECFLPGEPCTPYGVDFDDRRHTSFAEEAQDGAGPIVETLVPLPGLDGAGMLFTDLLHELPSTLKINIARYPTDRFHSYTGLVPCVEEGVTRRRLLQRPRDGRGVAFMCWRMSPTVPLGAC